MPQPSDVQVYLIGLQVQDLASELQSPIAARWLAAEPFWLNHALTHLGKCFWPGRGLAVKFEVQLALMTRNANKLHAPDMAYVNDMETCEFAPNRLMS